MVCLTFPTGTLPAQQLHQHSHLTTKPQGKNIFFILGVPQSKNLSGVRPCDKMHEETLSLLQITMVGFLKWITLEAFLSQPKFLSTALSFYCISF